MQRARGQEEKERRRREILNAALVLFSQGNGKMPSVVEIAKQAQMAKGTIYLYFKTREEIFLVLLTEKFSLWAQYIEVSIKKIPVEASSIVEGICAYIDQDPDLLLLASTLNSILEKNTDAEKLYHFRQTQTSSLEDSAGKLCLLFPVLSRNSAMHLLLQGYSMILGLWQVTSIPKSVQEMLPENELKTLDLNFSKEIRSALNALWSGTLNR